MNANFTMEVKAWLETPASERDYAKGALFLLQLSNNQIMYRNLMANPSKKAEFIEYQIRKYMQFRLQELTKAQVSQMQTEVDRIAVEHRLLAPGETNGSTAVPSTVPSAGEKESSEFRKGKRLDHEDLPAEIQALYVENASIMQQMRELHMQLRSLSVENATCPDSERYPFLKELIALDKRYHKNWQRYDSFKIGASDAEQSLVEDERQRQKNLNRQLNLTKGRYRKAPTEELRVLMKDLYSQITNPSEKLTADLREMGVIE